MFYKPHQKQILSISTSTSIRWFTKMMTKGYFKIFFIAQIAELINFAKKMTDFRSPCLPAVFFISFYTSTHSSLFCLISFTWILQRSASIIINNKQNKLCSRCVNSRSFIFVFGNVIINCCHWDWMHNTNCFANYLIYYLLHNKVLNKEIFESS